jgi:L-fuconate dehydratase
MKITALRARDVRFPTSHEMDGSDALNVGDYSAVYLTLETDGPHAGYGLTFTNGRGTEVGVAAARAFEPLVVGRTLGEITAHPVRVVNARYQAPLEPGYSIEMKAASLASHEYPGGSVWSGVRS